MFFMIRSVSSSVSKMNKWIIIRIRKLEQTPSITGFVKKWNSYNRWNSLSRTIDYLVTLHQASTDLPQYEKSRLSSQNKIQGLWII